MQQLGAIEPPRAGPESYLWGPESSISGDPGDPQENKLLTLRFVTQFWNNKDIRGLEETHNHNSTALGHNPAMPVHPLDYNAYKEASIMHLTAFSDMYVKIEDIMAEDDLVLGRWTSTGTHTGDLMGIPASGKKTTYSGMTMYRIADGKIVETWWAYDTMRMMQELTSPPEYSPVGTWIVTVPTPVGNQTWSHTISPSEEPGGNFAGIFITANSNPTNFGIFPEAEIGSDWVTQNKRIGPNTIETTAIGYGTKKGEGPQAETVAIYISHATWTLTGPNTNEGSAVTAAYTADQDADGDGFPDEGQEPVACLPYTFTSRRVTVMPVTCIPEMP
jgi:predicted ester cyclase